MLFKDLSFANPIENILYDEVLLKLAEDNGTGDVLRLWESRKLFVVLGRIGKIEEEVKIDAVEKDNIPVLRRSSGGGTVLQGKGCLNYSLVLSKEANPKLADLKASYRFISQKIVDALGHLNVQCAFFPISDIALVPNRKKFSGNAQKRGRKYILHHGTILYEFDLPLIERYLKFPQSIPEYRQNRSHLEFVTNVSASRSQITDQLGRSFNVTQKENILTEQEKVCLQELKEERKVIVGY